jgi:hypothetical protein
VQVTVLLLQPAHAPEGLRSLRAAASLLSPHSLLLSAQTEDLLQPRCSAASKQLSADGQPQQLAFGSALSIANQGEGLAAACAMMMTPPLCTSNPDGCAPLADAPVAKCHLHVTLTCCQ